MPYRRTLPYRWMPWSGVSLYIQIPKGAGMGELREKPFLTSLRDKPFLTFATFLSAN